MISAHENSINGSENIGQVGFLATAIVHRDRGDIADDKGDAANKIVTFNQIESQTICSLCMCRQQNDHFLGCFPSHRSLFRYIAPEKLQYSKLNRSQCIVDLLNRVCCIWRAINNDILLMLPTTSAFVRMSPLPMDAWSQWWMQRALSLVQNWLMFRWRSTWRIECAKWKLRKKSSGQPTSMGTCNQLYHAANGKCVVTVGCVH